MLKRALFLALTTAPLMFQVPLPASAGPIISAGTPTTTVPTYLSDGSYLFGITVTLGPDQFLLPVEITGAAKLQTFQFDVTFDNTVVQEVDPFDGASGIYGAEFTSHLAMRIRCPLSSVGFRLTISTLLTTSG
jgi:hypothetical protein